MRFVVTGTGRSGTGYASTVFTTAGIRCGHEEWFNYRAGVRDLQAMPRNRRVSRLASPALRVRRRRLPIAGDASWMAVPRLPGFRGTVFLQLRHPLKVIQSLVDMRFFTDAARYVPYRRFAAMYFDILGDDLLDAMRWWVEWNAAAASYADLTYQVERIDAELFSSMLEMVGVVDSHDAQRRAEQAIAHVTRDINAATRKSTESRPTLSWEDLPAGDARERLAEAARSFGYTPDDPDVSR